MLLQISILQTTHLPLVFRGADSARYQRLGSRAYNRPRSSERYEITELDIRLLTRTCKRWAGWSRFDTICRTLPAKPGHTVGEKPLEKGTMERDIEWRWMGAPQMQKTQSEPELTQGYDNSVDANANGQRMKTAATQTSESKADKTDWWKDDAIWTGNTELARLRYHAPSGHCHRHSRGGKSSAYGGVDSHETCFIAALELIETFRA